MKWNRKYFTQQSDGTVAVEFALVAPMLFLLIFGLIESGRLYFTRSSVQFAVEQAGRYAMVHIDANTSAISQELKANLIGVDPEDVTVTVTTQTVNGKTFKQINAAYSFTTVAGGLLNWGTIALNQQSNVPVINLLQNN